MRFVIVVNPASGRRHGDRVAASARDRLVAAGHEVVVVRSTQDGPTQIELAAALDRGADHVLAVGGDGLLHAVLDLVVRHDVTLGILPAGTGNDAARTLDVPVGDPDAALDVVLAGRTRTIDLAEVGDDTGAATLVATVVASGFDSKVNERANRMRWPRGNLRYLRAVVAELRTFEPLEFTLTLDDGEVLCRSAMLVAVGNGPSFGGGLRICEGAVVDDGLLDVVVINPVGKLTLLRVFPRLSQGTHTSLPQFERHRVRSVRLDSAGVVAYGDGERLGPLPGEVRVRRAALRVFVP